MFAVVIALFAAVPAVVHAAGEESAGGGSGEVVTESPGGSTEPPSTGWTGEGGSTGASSGGGAATPGTSLGSGGGQKSAGSTGGEHSSNSGSSGHSAPEPSSSAPEPTYSAPEPSSSSSFDEHASTPAPSGDNGPATGRKAPDPPPAKSPPIRIGLAAASAVAVSKSPPAAYGGPTPDSAAPVASSHDQVASGSDGLPFGVVVLLALILACAGALGVRHWDQRRKQQPLDAGPRQEAESEAVIRRVELEQAAAAFFEKGKLAGTGSESSPSSVAWRKPLRVFGGKWS
jgi:hypothetical protein